MSKARFRRSSPLTAIPVLLLGLGGVLTATGPAGAAIGDLTCTVLGGTANFNPPLQPGGSSAVTVEDVTLDDCTSLTGKTMQTGTAHATDVTATAASGLNPCSLLLTISGDLKIIWTPAAGNLPSTVAATLNLNPANGLPALSITVTAGSLAGDTGTAAPVITPNADCLTNGLSSLNISAAVVSFN